MDDRASVTPLSPVPLSLFGDRGPSGVTLGGGQEFPAGDGSTRRAPAGNDWRRSPRKPVVSRAGVGSNPTHVKPYSEVAPSVSYAKVEIEQMASKKKKSSITNPIAVAMMKRYGSTTTIMTNRNQKRKNRKSWKKDEAQAWG